MVSTCSVKHYWKRATGGAILAAALVLAACTKLVDPVPIASIQLQPGLDSMEIGQTYGGWVITIRDANGNTITGRKLSWKSQNTTVAVVDSNGVVTGIGSGEALITVSAEGKIAQATIRVLKPVMSVVATPDSLDLPLTTQRQITVQVIGPGGVALGNRAITFSTSDLSIVAVGPQGILLPLALGTVTVTVRAGEKEAYVRVRVVPEPVASVRITPQQSVHVVRLGQAVQLGAECLNAAQLPLTGRTITWNTSNPLVASVGSSGLVSGMSIGQATITATCDRVSAQVQVQVTPVPVSSVSITPGQLTLNAGWPGQQLTATARDSANNVLTLQGRSVVWSSDNLPIASVTPSGVVSGTAPGLAHVQVTVDGIASPAIDVTVQDAPVVSVSVIPVNGSVKVTAQIQMTAQLRDAMNNLLNGRQVAWSSLDTSIATIDPVTGLARGVAVGQVTIQAVSEGVVGTILLNVIP